MSEVRDSGSYYAILGVDRNSSVEQILAEFRIRALECHPDKNSSLEATSRFQKLQRAKETLVDEKLRRLYDIWLDGEIQMPFENWIPLKNSFEMCMHWATGANNRAPMLESKSIVSTVYTCKDIGATWNKSLPQQSLATSEIINQFRTYRI